MKLNNQRNDLMGKKLLLTALLFSFSSLTSAATLTSMTSSQAKKAFTDKTITTVSKVTLNGKLIDNTFTGFFNKDGTMVGKFATPPDNGGAQSSKGTWKVQSNGQFCPTWKEWFDGKTRCVTFFKLKNAILVVGPENNFETLILDDNIQNGNQMPS